jgi:hypothetical protein
LGHRNRVAHAVEEQLFDHHQVGLELIKQMVQIIVDGLEAIAHLGAGGGLNDAKVQQVGRLQPLLWAVECAKPNNGQTRIQTQNSLW